MSADAHDTKSGVETQLTRQGVARQEAPNHAAAAAAAGASAAAHNMSDSGAARKKPGFIFKALDPNNNANKLNPDLPIPSNWKHVVKPGLSQGIGNIHAGQLIMFDKKLGEKPYGSYFPDRSEKGNANALRRIIISREARRYFNPITRQIEQDGTTLVMYLMFVGEEHELRQVLSFSDFDNHLYPFLEHHYTNTEFFEPVAWPWGFMIHEYFQFSIETRSAYENQCIFAYLQQKRLFNDEEVGYFSALVGSQVLSNATVEKLKLAQQYALEEQSKGGHERIKQAIELIKQLRDESVQNEKRFSMPNMDDDAIEMIAYRDKTTEAYELGIYLSEHYPEYALQAFELVGLNNDLYPKALRERTELSMKLANQLKDLRTLEGRKILSRSLRCQVESYERGLYSLRSLLESYERGINLIRGPDRRPEYILREEMRVYKSNIYILIENLTGIKFSFRDVGAGNPGEYNVIRIAGELRKIKQSWPQTRSGNSETKMKRDVAPTVISVAPAVTSVISHKKHPVSEEPIPSKEAGVVSSEKVESSDPKLPRVFENKPMLKAGESGGDGKDGCEQNILQRIVIMAPTGHSLVPLVDTRSGPNERKSLVIHLLLVFKKQSPTELSRTKTSVSLKRTIVEQIKTIDSHRESQEFSWYIDEDHPYTGYQLKDYQLKDIYPNALAELKEDEEGLYYDISIMREWIFDTLLDKLKEKANLFESVIVECKKFIKQLKGFKQDSEREQEKRAEMQRKVDERDFKGALYIAKDVFDRSVVCNWNRDFYDSKMLFELGEFFTTDTKTFEFALQAFEMCRTRNSIVFMEPDKIVDIYINMAMRCLLKDADAVSEGSERLENLTEILLNLIYTILTIRCTRLLPEILRLIQIYALGANSSTLGKFDELMERDSFKPSIDWPNTISNFILAMTEVLFHVNQAKTNVSLDVNPDGEVNVGVTFAFDAAVRSNAGAGVGIGAAAGLGVGVTAAGAAGTKTVLAPSHSALTAIGVGSLDESDEVGDRHIPGHLPDHP